MSDHAVVVGAGFGGLAAAIRLRALGYRVTLVEAGDQLGGRARVFRRDGYIFDAGPTVITAPYLFDELFATAGRDRRDYVDFLPVDPFYQVSFTDGTRFDYVGDEARLLDQIASFDTRDVDGYRRMAEHARLIFDVGYTQLADQPFSRVADMLRIVPDMARLSAYRSVHALVSRYIRDPRLRQVFSFEPLLVGGNPMKVPGIYLLIHWLERKWGVHFARGGTGALVAALGRLLDELGVDVRFGAPVEQLLVENGRAVGLRLESGAELRASLVVANADPTVVYGKWIDPRHLTSNHPSRLARKRHSMSLFVGYFGTNRRYDSTQHHTIVLGPRYGELLQDIFERKVLADDFSLYLHRPGKTDPNLAPDGCDGFYVLSPVPNQESSIDWESKREAYFERILDELERRELPGLRQHLTCKFSVDPRYFEGELRSHAGAAFGLEPRLTQSAYFRYHNASPDVRDLYFVGASTHPGAGLPGVLCSAKVLERVLASSGNVRREKSGARQPGLPRHLSGLPASAIQRVSHGN
ncbi:MAG TPA: phytoene desaturase family protein [Polyangiaceae bacterium]|nr:phytoene desaturase family protein [Polyangiaceae bacterium]